LHQNAGTTIVNHIGDNQVGRTVIVDVGDGYGAAVDS
jgi:hypothetical protein